MLVATTETLLINAYKENLGRIIAWKDKQGLYHKIQISNSSTCEVRVSLFGKVESLIESIELNDWVLGGVKDKELQIAIQKSLE